MEALLEQVKFLLPSIQGWCSFEKAKKLIETIINNKSQLCVEIGVFGGSSLIPQAMALKHNGSGMLYGIDPWSNDAALEEMIAEEHKAWWSKVNLAGVHKHCQKNLDSLELNPFCKLLKNKAEEVVDQFADGSIDLLHIDGNHSEALSLKDAKLYLPKVKSGGVVFFDDIWWAEGGEVTTRKAILHLLSECKRVDQVNNDCLVLQKN